VIDVFVDALNLAELGFDGVAPEATGRPSSALATLVVNKLRGDLKVAAVKAPGFGDRRKAMLQDIAILTGGTAISEDLGIKPIDFPRRDHQPFVRHSQAASAPAPNGFCHCR
jgi:hypothetical protein